MRTRFLTDFFNSSAASHCLQTIDFLRFPPPQLPPSDLFNFDNLACFDRVNSVNVSTEIERFFVDESLCKLLADVLPHDINTEIDQQIAREVALENPPIGNVDFILIILRRSFAMLSGLIVFRIPNFGFSSIVTKVICYEFFFTASGIRATSVMKTFLQDPLDFSRELQQCVDIHKSIFCVEDICLEIQGEHKSDFFRDDSLVKCLISSDLRSFPLLEVDEISLGINSYVFEDKHMIFESNELQQWMHKDEHAFDSKELLLSMEFDILENLLNLSSLGCHKFEVPCVNVSSEYMINAIEDPSSPFALEQLQFFDTDSSHFSQVFSDTEIISEVEHCEQMFGNTTSSTFNELIVTHELVLADDSFRTLPVPIISDHEKILSVQMIVREIFVNLKLQPSSTSDDIYLDWHLLEEGICSDNKCTSLKMFGEDIDTYYISGDINADINSCDSLMLVLEFVLSDAFSNEQKTKENNEVLDVEWSGNLMERVINDGTDSSEICKKMASGEALVDNKVNKSHQLVESMLQFDDLDFFLNPLEATYVKKQKTADKILEMDRAFPVVSANNPTETHDTSRKQQQSLDNEIHSRGDFHSTSMLNESSKNLEGPSHFTHVEVKNNMKSLEATHELPQLPLAMESKKVNTNTSSLCDAIIIVNTRNGETEMIISRRSTYQKILEMEKEGLQVIERDLNLPVDVILSAAVCLVMYESKNIREKTNSLDGASSLPSCVENIAANVLTSVSFAFSSCILIFEGEVGFLGGIMESSDVLYAAAASLGIDLQPFYSYSSETTDEIILNCITNAAKSTRGLYPKMPESETLAESFLSQFTSLNPLSAHAILSSVGTLVEFFEMSHQQRVCVLKKYLVPQASITLFSALCRYGEREDSRSGMTDCCSSVSSGHDSGYCCPKIDYEQKKRKYIGSPETKAMPADYLFQFEKSNNVLWEPPKSVDSHPFWNSEADEISDGIGNSNAAFDEIYSSKSQRPDANMTFPRPSLTETSFGQSKKVHMPITDKFGSHTNRGEIIDIYDDDAMAGLYSSKSQRPDARLMLNRTSLTESSFGRSKKVHMPITDKLGSHTNKRKIIDIEDDDAMAGEDFSFLHPEKLSSEWFSLPSFSTAAEINSDLDSWTPTKDTGETLNEGFILNSQADLMNNSTTFKDTDPCYRRTPLSKAIFSDQPQKGSPWTIEFLNRIKEKSRMRHQSLPNISSAPCFGHSGNSLKFRKRKSPSILDFYRYNSSSAVKGTEYKEQKGPIQAPSSSKAVKTAPSSLQTWTPIDKRAKRVCYPYLCKGGGSGRQKLTFATSGSKGQSKLIWSDKVINL
ncbi:hypothetical protein SSX86_010769 [Deinandra increscens subsp. villosa]|uniref:Protein SHORTAGE IN CHIASMATA 1 n=1 Tax=Deinandra increscens subsp. villosa TaxID=3103831 RepID=A0AAP0DD39_9ASTR